MTDTSYEATIVMHLDNHAELLKRVLSVDKELQRSSSLLERCISVQGEDTLEMYISLSSYSLLVHFAQRIYVN